MACRSWKVWGVSTDADGGNLDDNDVVRGLCQRHTEIIQFLLSKRPHDTFKYACMIEVMTSGKNVCFNNFTLALPCYVAIGNANEPD